jgi:PPOX class probable F420-dependent enzyme
VQTLSLWPDDRVPALLIQENPALLAVVATVSADGTPHAVPLWFRWDGEAIVIWTGWERRWVRNLTGCDRVAVSVALDRDPFPGVLLRGRAEVRDAPAALIQGEITAITRRYVPADGVEAYIAAWPDLGVIVRIVPDWVSVWGAAEPDAFDTGAGTG